MKNEAKPSLSNNSGHLNHSSSTEDPSHLYPQANVSIICVSELWKKTTQLTSNDKTQHLNKSASPTRSDENLSQQQFTFDKKLQDKTIYIFDIDATLLVSKMAKKQCLLKSVPIGDEIKIPCHGHKRQSIYPIYPMKMKAIFEALLKKDSKLGFITMGASSKTEIINFFNVVYNINISEQNIPYFYSHLNDEDDRSEKSKKSYYLNEIFRIESHANINVKKSDIMLIDDNSEYISEAKRHGFSTIYADTNKKHVESEDHQTTFISTLEEKVGVVKNNSMVLR
jgi:hypothetical protein